MMPRINGWDTRYNLYFSHTWSHNETYQELNALLSQSDDFHYDSYFVPPDHPIHATPVDRKLYETIKSKMKLCHAAILLCGVYPVYSRWINKEIIACKHELDVPLIAVERQDAGPTSFIVKENADVVVGWNAGDIIHAVNELAKKK